MAPNDTCLLICGASGSGKSTLTLNLAAAGWDYLSDDVQVLFARGGGVVAQPLSRHFRLDPGVARLRALNDAVLGGVGKDGKVLVGQDGVLKGMFRDEARPSVLLFPRIEHADVSILRPIGDSDALLRLLTHFSVFGFSARHTREDLAMIRLLVQQCRSYEMSSGADVLKDPERVVELLADA